MMKLNNISRPIGIPIDLLKSNNEVTAMNEYQLQLPYPLSVNRYWRRSGHSTYLSQAGQEYKYTVKAIGMRAGVRKMLGDVQVNISILPKLTKKGGASKVIIDIDNGNKCILDALQGVLYEDDAQIKRLHIEYGQPVKDGGAIVTVGAYQ